MMKYQLPLLALMFVAAGCTDDVDSVTREYRATTNEAIDALMMITSEASAQRMTERVLKPMQKRYENIDKKLGLVKDNRGKKGFAKEVLESDGVHIYLTDLDVNKWRLALEMRRLKHLYKAEIDAGEVCPKLDELVKQDSSILAPLKKNLEEPELQRMMKEFPNWKVSSYDELFKKHMERRKTFLPKRDINLAP
jgi:hypothetical protein